MSDLLARIQARLSDWPENALSPQDAARAAADLAAGHQPSHTHTTTEQARWGDGRCFLCVRRSEDPVSRRPITVTPPDGPTRAEEYHCHGIDTEPLCELCGDSNELVPWPCKPLRRAASFLGVPIEDVSSVGGEPA